MSDEIRITEEGAAVFESGLSLRQAHEIKTGCSPNALCGECRETDRGTTVSTFEPDSPWEVGQLVTFREDGRPPYQKVVESLERVWGWVGDAVFAGNRRIGGLPPPTLVDVAPPPTRTNHLEVARSYLSQTPPNIRMAVERLIEAVEELS